MKLISKMLKMVEPESLSLCAVEAGGHTFGIDTRSVYEVLSRRTAQRVPLAPAYIGGMVAYRGEVLTAVSLRALLGHPPQDSGSYVLVLGGEAEDERVGLMVDEVGGVTMVEEAQFVPNPPMLDGLGKALFAGAFRLPQGLLVKLDPQLLQPARLALTAHLHGQCDAAQELFQEGI